MNVCLRFGDNTVSLLLHVEMTAARATEFIDGDIEQKDIPTQSGLSDAVSRLKHTKK
jgi:hypothetical protein